MPTTRGQRGPSNVRSKYLDHLSSPPQHVTSPPSKASDELHGSTGGAGARLGRSTAKKNADTNERYSRANSAKSTTSSSHHSDGEGSNRRHHQLRRGVVLPAMNLSGPFGGSSRSSSSSKKELALSDKKGKGKEHGDKPVGSKKVLPRRESSTISSQKKKAPPAASNYYQRQASSHSQSSSTAPFVVGTSTFSTRGDRKDTNPTPSCDSSFSKQPHGDAAETVDSSFHSVNSSNASVHHQPNLHPAQVFHRFGSSPSTKGRPRSHGEMRRLDHQQSHEMSVERRTRSAGGHRGGYTLCSPERRRGQEQHAQIDLLRNEFLSLLEEDQERDSSSPLDSVPPPDAVVMNYHRSYSSDRRDGSEEGSTTNIIVLRGQSVIVSSPSNYSASPSAKSPFQRSASYTGNELRRGDGSHRTIAGPGGGAMMKHPFKRSHSLPDGARGSSGSRTGTHSSESGRPSDEHYSAENMSLAGAESVDETPEELMLRAGYVEPVGKATPLKRRHSSVGSTHSSNGGYESGGVSLLPRRNCPHPHLEEIISQDTTSSRIEKLNQWLSPPRLGASGAPVALGFPESRRMRDGGSSSRTSHGGSLDHHYTSQQLYSNPNRGSSLESHRSGSLSSSSYREGSAGSKPFSILKKAAHQATQTQQSAEEFVAAAVASSVVEVDEVGVSCLIRDEVAEASLQCSLLSDPPIVRKAQASIQTLPIEPKVPYSMQQFRFGQEEESQRRILLDLEHSEWISTIQQPLKIVALERCVEIFQRQQKKAKAEKEETRKAETSREELLQLVEQLIDDNSVLTQRLQEASAAGSRSPVPSAFAK